MSNEYDPTKDETAEEMAARIAKDLSSNMLFTTPEQLEKEKQEAAEQKEGGEETASVPKSQSQEKPQKSSEEGDEEEEEAEAEDEHPVAHELMQDYSKIGVQDEVEASSSLWLITFTDTMALMLTFFVLLYSMSIPKEDEWKELTGAVQRQFASFTSQAFFAGGQDAIEIDKLDYSRALDLGYLKTLIQEQIEKDGTAQNVEMLQLSDRLVISMPLDLLFESGKADVTDQGRKDLFAIGGVLARIRNKIEVIGHSDPRPIENSSRYGSNWALSLARAAESAAILEKVGYRRSITIKGLSSARYDELPSGMSSERRENLSRRVDIVVLKDDGKKRAVTSVK